MNSSYTNFFGVDVASEKLDIHDATKKQHTQIANTTGAIDKWIRQIKRRKGLLVVMEATGGYEQSLVDALHDAGIDVAVCNPLQIRSFAKGIGIIEKNDPIDAAVIARFAQVAQPILRQKPSESERQLKALVDRRDQVLQQSKREHNRKLQSRDEVIRESIDAAIAFYKMQIKDLDKKIAKVIEACQLLKAKSEILSSCPGVGVATVSMLLSELPELGKLSRGQVGWRGTNCQRQWQERGQTQHARRTINGEKSVIHGGLGGNEVQPTTETILPASDCAKETLQSRHRGGDAKATGHPQRDGTRGKSLARANTR